MYTHYYVFAEERIRVTDRQYLVREVFFVYALIKLVTVNILYIILN